MTDNGSKEKMSLKIQGMRLSVWVIGYNCNIVFFNCLKNKKGFWDLFNFCIIPIYKTEQMLLHVSLQLPLTSKK